MSDQNGCHSPLRNQKIHMLKIRVNVTSKMLAEGERHLQHTPVCLREEMEGDLVRHQMHIVREAQKGFGGVDLGW